MMTMRRSLVVAIAAALFCSFAIGYTPPVIPPVSPATGLANKVYHWRASQQIRYQAAGPPDGPPVILVHGLFVNSDHWRKTLSGLAQAGYRAYALDMWGNGYSSKPPPSSPQAQAVNGERRFDNTNDGIRYNTKLGTRSGDGVRIRDVELKHPLQSPYNFYTWSELIVDFCNQVLHPDSKVTLVANSIGCISAFQAALDHPDLFRGVFAISPNFRELHSAEVGFPQVTMPMLRFIQSTLREKGSGLYDALAKPSIVKEILKEPYAVTDAVDDTLVKVLLDPLLTEGAREVVFDTLSYSAGPLPEPQLSEIKKPVWVCFGKDDPWIPAGRTCALIHKPPVEKVVGWHGVGHAPHDEAPELVNPLLLEFLNRVSQEEEENEENVKSENYTQQAQTVK